MDIVFDWIPCAIAGVFIVFDYISGLCKAFATKNVDSTIMRQGLWHKFSYVLIVTLAMMIEMGMRYLDFGFEIPLVVPACAYIVITEVASILENIVEINPSLKDSPVMQLFKQKETNREIGEIEEFEVLENAE